MIKLPLKDCPLVVNIFFNFGQCMNIGSPLYPWGYPPSDLCAYDNCIRTCAKPLCNTQQQCHVITILIQILMPLVLASIYHNVASGLRYDRSNLGADLKLISADWKLYILQD